MYEWGDRQVTMIDNLCYLYAIKTFNSLQFMQLCNYIAAVAMYV